MVTLVKHAQWIGLPSIVLGELWLGFMLGDLKSRNQRELEDFLSHPLVEEIPVDRAIAPIYGEISADLRKAGTPVPVNDIWIAAAAARFDVPVITYDGHFRSIRRVDSIILEPPA